jgi:hypothetical protein
MNRWRYVLLALVLLQSACQDNRAHAPAAATPSTMGPLELGINRLGRDESEFGTPAPTAADCSRHCAEDVACRAMSFMSRSAPQEGVCWLKTTVPEPTRNPAMVSAVKLVVALP